MNEKHRTVTIELPPDFFVPEDETLFIVRMGGVTCWGTIPMSTIETGFDAVCRRVFEPAFTTISQTIDDRTPQQP